MLWRRLRSRRGRRGRSSRRRRVPSARNTGNPIVRDAPCWHAHKEQRTRSRRGRTPVEQPGRAPRDAERDLSSFPLNSRRPEGPGSTLAEPSFAWTRPGASAPPPRSPHCGRERNKEADERPVHLSLGLLPSGPDPVGDGLVRRQPPGRIWRLGEGEASRSPPSLRRWRRMGSRPVSTDAGEGLEIMAQSGGAQGDREHRK